MFNTLSNYKPCSVCGNLADDGGLINNRFACHDCLEYKDEMGRNEMLIKNNKEKFSTVARIYFNDLVKKGNGVLYNQKKADFHYQVATNFNLYDTNVEYIENDFKKTLSNFVINNPFTQLMEVFADILEIDKIPFILDKDKQAINLRTISDAGSVMIGTHNFQALIPNGYGDGLTNIIISNISFDSIDKKIPMNYFTKVQGEIDIFASDDLGGRTIIHNLLIGEYDIYSENGTVIFNHVNRRKL